MQGLKRLETRQLLGSLTSIEVMGQILVEENIRAALVDSINVVCATNLIYQLICGY